MAVLGRQDHGSVTGATSSAGEARRFDATHRTARPSSHGHTEQQRRAALTLARGARDRTELRELLQMCGLLDAPDLP